MGRASEGLDDHVRGGGDDGGDHEGGQDRELEVPQQEARGHEADAGEDEDHDGDLEHEAEAEQEPRVEGEVLVDLRHEGHVLAAEGAQEAEGEGEEHEVAEGGRPRRRRALPKKMKGTA